MYLDNEIIDSVGLISFKGPKSYTGEDSFEVYGHGGLGVMGLMMDASNLLVLRRLVQESSLKELFKQQALTQ